MLKAYAAFLQSVCLSHAIEEDVYHLQQHQLQQETQDETDEISGDVNILYTPYQCLLYNISTFTSFLGCAQRMCQSSQAHRRVDAHLPEKC